jgi:hypothetical protein
MKKTYFLILMLLGYLSANSQITLEHTHTVAGSGANLTTVNLSSSGYKYVLTETESSQVKLYNTNHSLWKTLNIPTIEGFTLQAVFHISEGLFDINNEVEYVASYYNFSTNPAQFYVKVVNENGTVIKDLPNRGYLGVGATSSNTFKLIVTDVDLIREVYSLPGTSSTLRIPNTDGVGTLGNSFPNPATHEITIPYELNNLNSTGLINIYDNTGKLVESLTIDKSFDNIQLDLSNYSSGLYHYNIILGGNKSISKSFVKN